MRGAGDNKEDHDHDAGGNSASLTILPVSEVSSKGPGTLSIL